MPGMCFCFVFFFLQSNFKGKKCWKVAVKKCGHLTLCLFNLHTPPKWAVKSQMRVLQISLCQVNIRYIKEMRLEGMFCTAWGEQASCAWCSLIGLDRGVLKKFFNVVLWRCSSHTDEFSVLNTGEILRSVRPCDQTVLWPAYKKQIKSYFPALLLPLDVFQGSHTLTWVDLLTSAESKHELLYQTDLILMCKGITGDESWVCNFQWKSMQCSSPEKAHQINSMTGSMHVISL